MAQKQIEREHLHSFRCLCIECPKGDVTEDETPDFLVTMPDGRKIGIEHTQVFKKSGAAGIPEQADEAIKHFITNEATRQAELLSLPPANVTLFFNPRCLRRIVDGKRRSLTKSRKQQIAEEIAAFVGAHMPAERESVKLDWRHGQPRQADLILINRVHPIRRHNWRWMEMNFVQHDAIERLQAAITNKNKTYSPCISRCDEYWLLVVADSFQSSGTIHPDEASLSHVYVSPFNRVYFLDWVLGRVARLNLQTMEKAP